MAIKQDIKKWYNSELKGHSLIYKVLYIGISVFIYGLGILMLCMIIFWIFTGLSKGFSGSSSRGGGVRCSEYEWDSHGGRTCVDPEPVEYDYDYEPDPSDYYDY